MKGPEGNPQGREISKGVLSFRGGFTLRRQRRKTKKKPKRKKK